MSNTEYIVHPFHRSNVFNKLNICFISQDLKATVIPETESQYDETSKQSDDVKHHTSKPGQEIVNQEMLTLRAVIDGLQATINETENTLETCMVNLEQYEVEQAQFTEWLEAAENKIKTKGEPVEFETPEQQLVELEVCNIVNVSANASNVLFFSHTNIPIFMEIPQLGSLYFLCAGDY